MLDTQDFSFFENQNSFDFKGFLIKTLSYWKWFILSWVIAFTWAYEVNVRKEKIYAMENTISVKEENNPFFTANTSLVFNWGGTSDKVQTIASSLKSRSHNEKVVDKLQFYIDYLKEGKYNLQDAYGEVPFYVNIDKIEGQISGTLVKIKFISEKEYEIKITFEGDTVSLIHYVDQSITTTGVVKGDFIHRYKVGQKVSLPFFKLDFRDK